MTRRLVLVSGANGYIASRLIPRLLERGHMVRAMARDPSRLRGRDWLPYVEVTGASTVDRPSLSTAMRGIHTAYYLIHSMSTGHGYMDVERRSARAFSAAARDAGVQHILYLGGLADPKDPHIAPHMRSRIETGQVLRESNVPVTEFRAGVIAGAGSISFEMIRFLGEVFPVLPGPAWLRNLTQPIATENVIDYMVAGMEDEDVRGRVYEIGGPEILSYAETMLRYARVRGLKRLMLTLPGIPIWWMALMVDWLTPVPFRIATALVGGLRSDSRVLDDAARRAFPDIQLLPYEQAIRDALEGLTPARLERVWEGLGRDASGFKHEGFIIDYRTRLIHAPPARVFARLVRMGGANRWPFADRLWRWRGLLNRLIAPGRAPVTESRSPAASAAVGDAVDYHRVEGMDANRLLRLRSTLQAPGDGWLEWRIDAENSTTCMLTQTAFFAPRGLPGFLYLFLLAPIHRFVLRGLIKAIMTESERL